MPVQTMTRHASDNVYLHRDFHNILNLGLDYLHDRFGFDATVRYLRGFTLHFYAPRIDEIKKHGFAAVIAAFEKTYRDEEAADHIEFECTADELRAHVKRCPAVTHMLRSGVRPSRYFSLTSSVVWETISHAAGLGYAMLSYDPVTGEATHAFYKLSRSDLHETEPERSNA